MNNAPGVSVSAVVQGVHSGRVVGYGLRDAAATEDHFYVELKKQGGERVVFEGVGLRAELEAMEIDVGQTVTIDSADGMAPRIVQAIGVKGKVNMNTQDQVQEETQASQSGDAAALASSAPSNTISRAKPRRTKEPVVASAPSAESAAALAEARQLLPQLLPGLKEHDPAVLTLAELLATAGQRGLNATFSDLESGKDGYVVSFADKDRKPTGISTWVFPDGRALTSYEGTSVGSDEQSSNPEGRRLALLEAVERLEQERARLGQPVMPVSEKEDSIRQAGRSSSVTAALGQVEDSIRQARRRDSKEPAVAAGPVAGGDAPATDAPATLLNGRFMRDAKGEYRRVGQERVALADEGARIRFVSKEMDAFQAAVELAKAKGWVAIEVSGADEFKAKAWFHAKSAGVEVEGYEPTQKDLDRLFQESTQRFSVKLVDPKGKATNHAMYSEPEEAMSAYLALTKADFGSELGVGSYAALTDREGKLDAARVATGRGTYDVKFAKDDGRKLFASLEAAAVAAAEVNAPPSSEMVASRRDAQKLALESGFSVKVANAADGRYAGPVIRETAHHVVQDLGRKESVVHDKFRLAGLPTDAQRTPSQSVRIQYQGGRGKVEATVERTKALAR